MNNFGFTYYRQHGAFEKAIEEANSVLRPHGDQTRPDGKCPPEMNFMEGYCHECCLNRKFRKERSKTLGPRLEYLQAQFAMLIVSETKQTKTKLMLAYQKARDLCQGSTDQA